MHACIHVKNYKRCTDLQLNLIQLNLVHNEYLLLKLKLELVKVSYLFSILVLICLTVISTSSFAF